MQVSVSNLGFGVAATKDAACVACAPSGGGFGGAYALTGSLMDKPGRSTAQSPVSKMLGRVMSIPGLANLPADAAPNPVLTRANNMASLVAAMLLKFKPEHREEMLIKVGGLNWTSQVLNLAKSYPGALGVSDAIRFSLALHFLIGLMDSDSKQPTFYAAGYQAFKRVLEDAQMRRAEGAGLSGMRGLGGFGLGGLGGFGALGQTAAQLADARSIATAKFARELERLNREWSGAAEAENDGLLAEIDAQIASLQANKEAWIQNAMAAYLQVRVEMIAQAAQQQAAAVAQQQQQQQVQVAPVYAAPPPPPPAPSGVAAGAATVAPESKATGVIDSLTPDGQGNFIAQGWACVRGRPEFTAVKFYAGGPDYSGSTFIGETVAKATREAAVGAACGLTNSNRGFTFIIPASVVASNDGRSLHVHGQSSAFGGRNEGLDNTGKFVLKSAAKVAAEAAAEAARVAAISRSPGDLAFRPPDRASLDYSKFQVAACYTPPFYILTPEHKAEGIRIQFQRTFGRQPNNAEVQYYGELKWCTTREGTYEKGEAMENTMRLVAQSIRDGKAKTTTPGAGEGIVGDNAFDIRTATSDMERAIQRAADDALNFVGKAADFVIDVLCKGFRQLLGDAVGGAVCDVLKVVINVAASAVVAASKIITDALTAIVGFIRELIAGRTEQAFMVLLKGVGKMLFNLSAPVMVPVLMKGRSLADGFRELDALAVKVVNRNPLFPLMLIMAIVGVLTAPTPIAIGALVLAMAPMIGVFIAPGLKKLEPLKDAILEDIERGVEKMMKLCIIVIQGLMDISALMSTLKAQLVAYFEKKFKNSETAWKFAGDLLKNLGKGLGVIIEAVRTFQFGTITEQAVKILSIVPELLLAILPDAVAELPALSQWLAAAKNAGDSVERQQANLAMGAREILRNMGAPDRILFIQEQVMSLTFHEAAGVAARIVGEQFKKQATYPQFITTFKAELLKV